MEIRAAIPRLVVSVTCSRSIRISLAWIYGISDNLHVKEVIGGGSGVRRRMYLVGYNLHEALRQSQHRLEVVSQLKVELARHKNRKATPQWAIDLLVSPLPEGYRAWRRTTRHKCYQGCGY